MKKCIRRPLALLLMLCMVFTMLPVTSLAETNLVQADGWTIENQNDNLVINNTNSITITTEKGDFSHDENAGDPDNYWIRTPADKDFTLTVKVSGGLNANYQKAGIMVYKDKDTVASVVRRYHSNLTATDLNTKPGNVIGMFQYLDGYAEPVVSDPHPDQDVYLKLVKEGASFQGYFRYSEDEEWTSCGSLTNATVANAADMKIGVFAAHGPTDAPAAITIEDLTYNGELIPFAEKVDGDILVTDISVATSTGRTGFTMNEKNVQLLATVAPTNATNMDVVWSVEPSATASINAKGKLTVCAIGTYTVTATAADGSGVSESIELTFTEATDAWSVDDVTKADWIGTYGADGYVLCAWNNTNDVTSLPYYIDGITYTYQDRSGGYIARTAKDYGDSGWEYGLPNPEDPDGTRKLAYQFDDAGLTVHIAANDEYEHQLTFYCVAESENGRQQSVQLLDPETGAAVSDAVVMTTMSQGKYITITFSGSVDVLFHNDNYNSLRTNVVVNGIFFDTVYEGDSIPVRSLSIAPEDGEVIRTELGEVKMSASAMPATASDKSVTWSVDNEDVASVSDDGVVTIKKAGTFTVTAVSKANPEISDSVAMVAMDGAAAPEKTQITILGDSFAMIQNSLVQVIFDLHSGYYSVYEQESGLPFVLNAYFQVNSEKSYKGYTFSAAELEAAEDGKTMRLTGVKEGCNDLILDISLEDDAGDVMMRAGITNNSGAGTKVMQMYPMAAKYAEKGGIFVGPDPDDGTHALLTGEGNWTVPQVKDGVTTTSKNNLLLSYRNNPELESFLIGQLTTYSFQSTITTTYNDNANFANNGRNSIDADIRIYDNTGKLVDDGATYVGDIALINFTTKNPYDTLDDYAWRQADAMEVDLIDFDPYIYECLWYVNWYTPGSNNVEYALKEVGYLQEKGLANYAIPNLRVEPDTYVNPNEQLWWDDAHWLSFGHLSENYPTMGDWIDAMHELGAEGGIYMQASYRSNDYCAEYPEQMIGNVYEGGPDYTDPDFQAHMAEVYTRLKEDGVRSIFYDYAGQYKGPGASYLLNLTGGFEDEYATAVEAYRMIFQLPKTYIGSDVRISENSWEYSGSDLAIGLIDIQRNIIDTNKFTPEIATVAINQWYRHRKTKLLYSDVKVFENDNEDLRRAQITGTGFFFGKTTLGESVNRMSDQKIKDIGKIVPFPVDGIAARPVGLFEGDYVTNPYVYDYKFDSQYDDHILLFWNQEASSAMEISADLGMDTAFGGVGLDENKQYEAWDFWNWEYVGSYQGSDILTQTVRTNEMRTMALREVREEPYLLSTNRHVLQGTEEIDVKAFEYDAATKTVTGTFDIVGNDTFKAIISMGNNDLLIESFSFDNENVTGCAKQNAANGYVEITLDAEENQTVNFTLVLKEGTVEDDTIAPSAIEGLTASADEYGFVTLTWEPSVDDNAFIQLSYEVYGSAEADFEPSAENRIAVTSLTNFMDPTVHAGAYFYKVRALDGAGNTTGFASVKTDAEVLAVVSDKLAMTTGSYEAGEGPECAVDGNAGSLWHTDWSGTDRSNMWLDMQFPEPTAVNAYAYLPRDNNSKNGMITGYELYASTDNGENYALIDSGTWALEAGWKVVTFEEMTVTNLKLVATASYGNYASAAEVKAYRTVEISSIAAREAEMTLAVDSSKRLLVDVYPTNLQGEAVTYASDNEAVATVDENGVVTGVAEGTATITVTSANGKTTTCVVTVEKIVEVTGVEITKTELVIEVGEKHGLIALVTPEDAADKSVTWSSSDESVATVKKFVGADFDNSDGRVVYVIAVAAGTATITVTTANGKTAQCVITVNAKEVPHEDVCKAKNFSDVDLDEWYHDAIDFVLTEGIMSGDAEGTFRPQDSITRGEMAQILYNIENKPAYETKLSFSDVEEGNAAHWFYDAVMWAAANGYVKGDPEGTYRPDDLITREEMVTIIWRYFGSEEPDNTKLTFADAGDEYEWAVDAIAWAVEHKVVQGTDGNRFAPKDDTLRCEIAQVMKNIFDK